MKIDFNKAITNFKGELMKVGVANIFVKDVICTQLSMVSDATKEDKQKLTDLSAVIWNSKPGKDTEITPEDATLLRKYLETVPVSVFSQVYNILG